MTKHILGGCLCGAVRYRAEGAARFGILCHCADCQRLSGAGGLPQVAFTLAEVEITGPVRRHQTTSDAGFRTEGQFCETCGSLVARSTERAPDMIFLTAGTFDNPDRVPELKPVYEASRPSWDGI